MNRPYLLFVALTVVTSQEFTVLPKAWLVHVYMPEKLQSLIAKR